eukprot:CFRG3231T1
MYNKPVSAGVDGDDVDEDETEVVRRGHNSGKADMDKMSNNENDDEGDSEEINLSAILKEQLDKEKRVRIERMVRDRKLQLVPTEDADVQVIKTELELDEAAAKLLLQQNGGDIVKAMNTFVNAE